MKKGSKMKPDSCERIRLSKLGSIPWNKGKRSSSINDKQCKTCHNIFYKDTDSSNKLWEKRIFCSKSCVLVGNTRTLGKNLGKDNASWKGGITSVNAVIRSSFEMNEWRKSVFKRDDYTCKSCNIRGKRLHAHHILSFSKFPYLRFSLENGLTLCKECHKLTDNYAGRA